MYEQKDILPHKEILRLCVCVCVCVCVCTHAYPVYVVHHALLQVRCDDNVSTPHLLNQLVCFQAVALLVPVLNLLVHTHTHITNRRTVFSISVTHRLHTGALHAEE